MKRMMLLVLGISALGALGAYLYQDKHTAPAVSDPVTAASSEPSAGDSQEVAKVDTAAERSVPMPAPAATAAPSKPMTALARRVFDRSDVNRAVDMLVSPQATYAQKHEAWRQLKDSGNLDQAIAELEQRTASDPQVAAYPAALGEAYLKKCGTIQDVREQGILAMQADKLFDTALSLDPANWEARFTKAVAMSYWPPTLNKGDEVIQNFQTLIQQQESEAPQPQFAETYAWLGDQYQKAGRNEDARAVWQRGLSLYPDSENLSKKLTPAQ